MKQRYARPATQRTNQKQGWDALLREYEVKRRNAGARTTKKHLSMGMGHHFARMMKGHI